MIALRARAFAIRDGAADALMGLQISDEVSDYGPDKARDVTPDAPRRGGVIYRDPDPVPALDVIEDAEPAIDPDALAAAEAEALAEIKARDEKETSQ
jgi:hypothetical protein